MSSPGLVCHPDVFPLKEAFEWVI